MSIHDRRIDGVSRSVATASNRLMLWVERFGLDDVRLLHGDTLDLLRDRLPPESPAGMRLDLLRYPADGVRVADVMEICRVNAHVARPRRARIVVDHLFWGE